MIFIKLIIMTLTISYSNDNYAVVDKWINSISHDHFDIVATGVGDKFIAVSSHKSVITDLLKDNEEYKLIDYNSRYACVIPDFYHQIIMKIPLFNIEVIEKIIELYNSKITYVLYDGDNKKVCFDDLITWKDELMIDLCTPKEVSKAIVNYFDSFIFGLILMILALVFYAFT